MTSVFVYIQSSLHKVSLDIPILQMKNKGLAEIKLMSQNQNSKPGFSDPKTYFVILKQYWNNF